MSNRENDCKMLSKSDILSKLSDYINRIEHGEDVSLNISDALYYRYLINLNKFKLLILATELPESFGDDWYYTCFFYDTKFVLQLNKDYSMEKDSDGNIQVAYQALEILKYEIKLLTAHDYAKINNVTEGAVRQWIRRGKLLNAIKFGNEWRIPELSDVNYRIHHFQHHYYWDCELYDIPLEICESYIKKYDSLIIKELTTPKKYNLHFFSRKGGMDDVQSSVDIELPIKDKEKLELWMIANPLVKTPASLIDALQ